MVWLEECSPDYSAFLHALEWAIRLALPLRAVRISCGSRTADPRRIEVQFSESNIWPPLRLPDLNSGCTLETFAEISCVNEVEWSIVEDHDVSSNAGVCVISAYLPEAARERLARKAFESRGATLLCASEWSPVRRPLILNDVHGGGKAFLQTASDICRRFRAKPVVLTVAATESEAIQGHHFARSTVLDQGQLAQFDYAVHWNLNAIVELEANCRRCTHLIADSNAGSKRRWARRPTEMPFLDLSRSLSVLLLGENAVAAISPERAEAGSHISPGSNGQSSIGNERPV